MNVYKHEKNWLWCVAAGTSGKQYHRTLPQLIRIADWYSILRLGHTARAHVSGTNARYGRVAEVSCCNMGWILVERGGRCSWSVAKNTKYVSVQKVVTLNTCCDVACLTFQLPHVKTVSFQIHQCQPTSGSFQRHQRLEECKIQGSVVTFFRCGA